MVIDNNKLKRLKQPMDLVLGYDLEKLQCEDGAKRASLWNQIKSSEALFHREYYAEIPKESHDEITGKIALAKLLLAAAAKFNSDQPSIVKQFSNTELALIANSEKFNVFDVISVEEIADRIERRKDLRNLAIDFYQNEYNRLDEILEAPDIQKGLKVAFNLRYKERLNKTVQGIQAYIRKYGIPKEMMSK